MVGKPASHEVREAAREIAKEQMEDTLLTAKEVGEMLGIIARTVRQLVAKGELQVIRISRRCMRFRRSDVKAYIESCRGRPLAPTPRKRRKVSNGE